MAFTPKLFIGIGSKSHFYTLRETYLHFTYSGGCVLNGVYQGTVHKEVRSFHHFNLSQDAAEAIQKAKEAAIEIGIPLEDVSVEDLYGRLQEIERATKEQLEERARREEQQRKEWADMRALQEQRDREVLAAGFYPLRRFSGEPLEKVDLGYVHWLVGMRDEFEEGSMMRAIADKYIADYPEMMPRFVSPTKTIGGPKEKIEVNVHVIRQAGYQSEFGYVNVITMVMDDGTCLVSKGRFKAEPGQDLRIKATVKEHSEYRDQMQTVINRVKVVE